MDKKPLPYRNIDEYIAQSPAEAQPRLAQLRQVIREVAPQATEIISWGMPTFQLHGNLVHFALAKKHVGFYPGENGVAVFLPKLEGYETSKGAIRLPLSQPLPLELIREIVAFRVAENMQLAEGKRAALDSKLESLPNMGKVLAANLRAVGIETPAQLRQAGAKDAFLRIRAAVDPGACLRMLYGLQGAIEGVRDTLLAPDDKKDLKRFFDGL